MTAALPEPARLLAWDTAFFGRRIGRVVGDRMDAQRVVAVDAWARANDVACVYFLARADEPATPAVAETAGYRCVDIRLTFELSRPTVSPARAGLRLARPDDLSTLQALARASHVDTRFFFDTAFDTERARTLYTTWIEHDCLDPDGAVWVPVDADDRALGYLSCKWADPAHTVGEIGLVAVDPRAQGQGLGRALVEAGLNWFAERGATRVTVVTQGRNLAAQRLYQRCGFLTQALALWFHKWFPYGDGADA